MSEQSSGQPPEDLDARFRALVSKSERINESVIRHKQDLESTQRELDAARRQAREEFGTDDVDELRKLFYQRRDENLAKLTEFEKALDEAERLDKQIRAQLAELDQ